MTVADLKQELEYYEDDAEVVFELNDDISVDSWTEDRYGNKSVHIDTKLDTSFISEIHGDMRIELGKERDNEDSD